MTAETRSPHFQLDATARTYRDIHLPRVFTPWATVLLEIVPPKPGETVLDVATGPGTVARQAAVVVGTAGKVVGVDISSAMLGVARAWPPDDRAAAIEYIQAPATSMPLADAAFDVAYCQQGLQHMGDPLAALREMRRLLKPGGRLGVATWQQSPFGIFRETVASMGVGDGGPQPSNFGRDAEGLAEALREAGFEVVEVQTREMVSVLEGGIPQALEVAVATSGAAAMKSLPADEAAAVRAAIAAALQPRLRDGAVHLLSISNIGSGRRPA